MEKRVHFARQRNFLPKSRTRRGGGIVLRREIKHRERSPLRRVCATTRRDAPIVSIKVAVDTIDTAVLSLSINLAIGQSEGTREIISRSLAIALSRLTAASCRSGKYL